MLPGMQSLLSRHATRADVAESQAALERWFAALAEVPAHGHERDGDRAGGKGRGRVGGFPRNARPGGFGPAGAVGQSAVKRRVSQQRGGQQHRAGSDGYRSPLAPGSRRLSSITW